MMDKRNKWGIRLQRFHERVAEKIADHTARTVIILALGDSVTVGAATEGVILHNDVYHAQLKRLLEKQYPACVFSVINAGVSGQSAPDGLQRLERDVLLHQPDLLLLAFGLNDAHQGFSGLDNYKSALQSIIEKTRDATQAEIILLTPNMMVQRDNDNVPERWQHATSDFVRLQTEGVTAAYAEAVREVGINCQAPVADIYAAWLNLENEGLDTTAMLANGLNHPDSHGHQIAAKVLFDVMQ